ncbi:hypothetical protein OIU34_19705 [Pararhizobium sp. BT-229]|uniref:hypothetical protein n=1 Tax=Pararhizobium sp. BT-229 TaxID=2986923 RepID=UPI0021F6B0C9|nr:hypothetical protein [Pararhizobium sp. BT-229]MCV9964111.1 hypothetical protein [Pararhizobium sp. BT-229]
MKAYLPYVYNMAYVPPKRVKPVLARVGGTIEVDVPEISLADTWLAASFEYVLERRQGTVVMPTEFRAWNGSLLARVTDELHPVFKSSWLPSMPGARSERASAFKPLYGFLMFDGDEVEKYARGDVAGAVDYHEPPPGRIDWSHGDRVYSTVKRLADDLVSVDGELWRKTEFAALCLDTRQIHEDRPLWASFIEKPYGFLPFTRDTVEERSRYPTRKLFDVSEVERLMRHAGPAGADLHFRSLIVHDAAALAFDGEREFIREAMDFAVLAIEGSIGDMPARAVLAWSDMRSAVERVSTTPGENFTDGEIDSFRYIAEEYRGERSNLVREALAGCDEYMNDPWGRYGSHTSPTQKGLRP